MATYTDSFTGADATALNTHDANWYGVGSSYGGVGTLQLNANRLRGAGHAVYAQAIGADAYVQATVASASNSTDYLYLRLRRAVSSTTNGGVSLAVKPSGATSLQEAGTSVWSDATTWPLGTVVRLEIEGTDARIYKDGSLLHTYAGISVAAGADKYAGLSVITTSTYWDDWEAGDLVPANQTASPTEDISNTGWTASAGGALYGAIDEVTRADADYIYCTASGSVCEVKLAAVSQPDTGTHTVSYALYSTTSDDIEVKLVENQTVRQTWTHAPAPATVTEYTQTITTPANITDWANLRLRFTATTAV